jgi:hypothetical protein
VLTGPGRLRRPAKQERRNPGHDCGSFTLETHGGGHLQGGVCESFLGFADMQMHDEHGLRVQMPVAEEQRTRRARTPPVCMRCVPSGSFLADTRLRAAAWCRRSCTCKLPAPRPSAEATPFTQVLCFCRLPAFVVASLTGPERGLM